LSLLRVEEVPMEGAGASSTLSWSPSSWYSKWIGTNSNCRGQELALVTYLREAPKRCQLRAHAIYLQTAFGIRYRLPVALRCSCEKLVSCPSGQSLDYHLPLHELSSLASVWVDLLCKTSRWCSHLRTSLLHHRSKQE
jgi:hypothetical protein